MTDGAPDLVPLANAVLCMDCNQISAAKNGHCPGCGSEAIARLEKMLSTGVLKDLRALRVAMVRLLRKHGLLAEVSDGNPRTNA